MLFLDTIQIHCTKFFFFCQRESTYYFNFFCTQQRFDNTNCEFEPSNNLVNTPRLSTMLSITQLITGVFYYYKNPLIIAFPHTQRYFAITQIASFGKSIFCDFTLFFAMTFNPHTEKSEKAVLPSQRSCA